MGLPHQLVRAPGHSRDRSLWIGLWWIEEFTVHGPGGIEGERTELTDEQAGFTLDCYAHDAKGSRLYDSAFYSRPKGADKSGISSRIALFEALGPCRFAGWAEGGETYEFLGKTYVYAEGEAMGKPVVSPVVRIAATEEEQLRDGMWASILTNFNHENAPLAALKAYGLEAGVTRVMLPGSGKMLASTAGSKSKDGGKETFYAADETHLYYSNALREMHDTIVRNVGKRRREGSWYLETTTMYAPGQGSVAESTYEYAEQIRQGKAARQKLLFDHRFGELRDDEGRPVELGPTVSKEESARLEKALRQALVEAYADAVAWMDIDGLVDQALDPRRDVVETMRYYLNAIYDVKSQWLPNAHINAALEAGKRVELNDGDEVTIGFDGAVRSDATAVVLCRVSDGALFLWHIQQEPDSPDKDEWEVDRIAVDEAVRAAFKRFTVVGMFADPPFWREYIDRWHVDFEDNLLVAAGTHKIEWWTKNVSRMYEELERFREAVAEGVIPFGEVLGHPSAVMLATHARNARVRERGERYILGKESAKSPKKIDAVMAAVLAYACRAKYLWRGEKPEEPEPLQVPIRVR